MFKPQPSISLILLITVLGGCDIIETEEPCPAVAPQEYGTLVAAPRAGDQALSDASNFPPVAGATIELYEDDEIIDQSTSLSDGSYRVGFGDACRTRGALTTLYKAEGFAPLELEWKDGLRVVGLNEQLAE